MDQRRIYSAIQAFYSDAFDEDARLTTRSPQGRLEFERTQEIVRAAAPAPARVLDVGGATGVHAAALALSGYDVVLVDPVESQVAVAARIGTFAAVVGDARELDFPDDSFDAVLMAGPLYHLADRRDRLTALREARRVSGPVDPSMPPPSRDCRPSRRRRSTPTSSMRPRKTGWGCCGTARRFPRSAFRLATTTRRSSSKRSCRPRGSRT